MVDVFQDCVTFYQQKLSDKTAKENTIAELTLILQMYDNALKRLRNSNQSDSAIKIAHVLKEKETLESLLYKESL